MKTRFEKINEAMERDGEPDDQFLNNVEKNLILPKIEEHRIKTVVCKEEKEALEACQKKYGIFLAPICLFDSIFYGYCVSSGRGSDDVKDDCMEEYLAVRSRYRLTKDPKMLERLKRMVYPHKYPADKESP